MEKRRLGQSDILISPLGLGTVKFGRNQGVKYPHGFEIPDEAFLDRFLGIAKELGINMLDTAPAYGLSEERLGRLLNGPRDDWVIVGKAGEEFEDGDSSYNFTPDHFQMSVERSLKRLNTDYIDALLIHSDGSDMDILSNEALIRTLENLKRDGKVRAIGASTKTVDGGIKALELMDVVMCSYNPAYEDERPVLDYAQECGKAAILKKALASGHVDQFEGQDPVQHAMDFAFAHGGTTAMIVGTINPDHLRDNVNKAQLALAKT